MLVHPAFDPVAFHLGPLAVRWYGLTLPRRLSRSSGSPAATASRPVPGGVWTPKDIDDALFYGILGTLLGGRLGYVLFYKFAEYAAAPWKVFYVWEGGMSFHGGFLGVVLAMILFARSRRQDWLADHRLHRAARAARARRRRVSATSSTPSSGAGPRTCRGR
jgi:phosphatidylglycerol:prolipoprotein diacylglycerol transferase